MDKGAGLVRPAPPASEWAASCTTGRSHSSGHSDSPQTTSVFKLLYVLERHTDEAVFPKREQKVKWKMVQVEETAKCRCGCSVTGPAGTSRPSLPAPPRGARPRAPGLAWAGAGGAGGGGGSLVGFRGRIAAVQETLAPVVLSSTEGATRHVVPYGAG